MDLKENINEILNEKNNIFVVAVIIAAIFIGLAVTVYSNVETSSQNNTYKTQINVTPGGGPNASLGLDADSEMSFGRTIEGSNITKTIELSSQDLTLVESTANGNISNNLYFEERVLFKNETEIEYKYAGMEPGYFEGEILLEIKTADNYWGEKWLELLYSLPF